MANWLPELQAEMGMQGECVCVCGDCFYLFKFEICLDKTDILQQQLLTPSSLIWHWLASLILNLSGFLNHLCFWQIFVVVVLIKLGRTDAFYVISVNILVGFGEDEEWI